jgi:hypothetical protein
MCQLIIKTVGILHNLALNSKLKYFGKQKRSSAFYKNTSGMVAL